MKIWFKYISVFCPELAMTEITKGSTMFTWFSVKILSREEIVMRDISYFLRLIF